MYMLYSPTTIMSYAQAILESLAAPVGAVIWLYVEAWQYMWFRWSPKKVHTVVWYLI